MLLLYIMRNQRPELSAYARLRKYFFNIQWHKEKKIQAQTYTFKITMKQLKSMKYCK